VKDAHAEIDDGGVIDQIIRTGEHQVIFDIATDSRVRFRELAEAAGWVSMLGYPIKVRGRTAGVIELLTFDTEPADMPHLANLRPLAEMASITLENAVASRQTRRLSEVSQALAGPRALDAAMNLIVESARDLTDADWSVIYLEDQKPDDQERPRFVPGASTVPQRPSPEDFPRALGGLTSSIIEDGCSIRIDDTSRDERVRQTVVEEGVASLIGVRMQLEEERIGVLYANSRHACHFTAEDTAVLENLARQASFTLGWLRLLSRDLAEIESALKLAQLEDAAQTLCRQVEREFGFDFVAVQWVREDERLIETIAGTGMADGWVGNSKHHLADDPALRDIQADVVLERQVEIIAGFDPRFDRGIYESFGHDKVKRLFAPLVLLRDDEGRIQPDWLRRCTWREVVDEKDESHSRLALAFSEPPDGGTFEVLGTIEGGFRNRGKEITAADAQRCVEFVTERVRTLYETSLLAALEKVVELARKMIHADSATLHLGRTDRGYVYEVAAGRRGRHILLQHKPRPEGLGSQAQGDNRPLVIPDLEAGRPEDDLKERNPKIYAEGIHAIAAFPLHAGSRDGVLYIHFRRPHRFTQDELDWVEILAKRACEAVRAATAYAEARDLAQQLLTLHSIARSLISLDRTKELLGKIAWNTLNLMGADVVTLYEYNPATQEYLTPPEVVGRLKLPGRMSTEIHPHDAPVELMKHGLPIYALRSSKDPILNAPGRHRRAGHESFVSREGIVASAALPLRTYHETVGALFVNYRHAHVFSEEEKSILETLASVAAIAIKNRRLVDAMRAVDPKMRTTFDLEAFQQHIVGRARESSQADRGSLWLVDPIGEQLVQRACAPAREHSSPVVAIADRDSPIAKAVREKATVLHDRPSAEPRAGEFPSALCVPLVDASQKAVGVLAVESRAAGAFHRSDQYGLDALATEAVLRIESAEREQRMLAAEQGAMVGHLAEPILDWVLPEVHGIMEMAHEIKRMSKLPAHVVGRVDGILTTAHGIDAEGDLFFGFIHTDVEATSVRSAVDQAIEALRSRSDLPTVELKTRNDVPANLPAVRAAHRPLSRVFSILFENAVQAMGNQIGILTVEAERIGSRVRVVVSDTGVGIPQKHLEDIFKPNVSFWRSDGGAPAVRLGFGLWWARAYLHHIKGSITVESSVGSGSRFIVEIRVA